VEYAFGVADGVEAAEEDWLAGAACSSAARTSRSKEKVSDKAEGWGAEGGAEPGGEPGGEPGERGGRGEAMDAHASWVRASDSSSACRGSSELIQGRARAGCCSGAVGERE
jgi:hypothetical protein